MPEDVFHDILKIFFMLLMITVLIMYYWKGGQPREFHNNRIYYLNTIHTPSDNGSDDSDSGNEDREYEEDNDRVSGQGGKKQDSFLTALLRNRKTDGEVGK